MKRYLTFIRELPLNDPLFRALSTSGLWRSYYSYSCASGHIAGCKTTYRHRSCAGKDTSVDYILCGSFHRVRRTVRKCEKYYLKLFSLVRVLCGVGAITWDLQE